MIQNVLRGCALLVAAAAVPHAQAGEYAFLTNYAYNLEWAIDIEQAGEFEGAVFMRKSTGNPGQHWNKRDVGNGWIELTNEYYGPDVCMTALDEPQMPNGVMIAMRDCEEDWERQRWYMEPAGEAMIIANMHYGPDVCMTLDYGGEFLPYAYMAQCDGSQEQYWYATPTGRFGPD